MNGPQETETDKGDAVCFTAGPKGAIFGLGVIHAYLAADRIPPKVVAGVSTGALSAAAMQRCYRELEDARTRQATPGEVETARWKWFRRYLSFLIERPLDVLWRVIPDMSDLLANRPPIRETALPRDPDGGVNSKWQTSAQRSRHEYYVMAKAFRWLAHLRMSPRSVVRAAVSYVRWKEVYPDRFPPWKIARWISFANLVLGGLRMLFWFALVVTIHPSLYWPWPYERESNRNDQPPMGGAPGHAGNFRMRFPRPLFGWAYLFMGPCLAFSTGALLAGVPGVVLSHWLWKSTVDVWEFIAKLGVVLATIVVVWLTWQVSRERGPTLIKLLLAIPRELLNSTGLRDSLVSDFYLRLKLDELFRRENHEAMLDQEPMPALLVASPLEPLTLKGGKQLRDAQLYTRRNPTYPLVDALCACLAVPVFLRPAAIGVTQGTDHRTAWLDPDRFKDLPETIHLVDGAPVCPNPLPALFDQLKQWRASGDPDQKQRVESLRARSLNDARVHLVHSAPLEGQEDTGSADLSRQGEMAQLPNCVEVAFDGLHLSSRRDSRLEVWQTNYQSELALAVNAASGPAPPSVKTTLTVLADEIAPEEDLKITNPLDPKESPMLRYAAAGCRATLAVLFRGELAARPESSVDCPSFLETHVDRVDGLGPGRFQAPGLGEICSHCTKLITLHARDRKGAAGVPYSETVLKKYVSNDFLEDPAKTIPENLCRGLNGRPRIVFLASGGVFRGAFHIGMLGAMSTLNMKPDLIVGASVGTLMGAVLGEIFTLKARGRDGDAQELLHDLVDTFVEVDERVALTHQFKSAMRDLATRANTVKLSPNRLRRKVLRGAARDPAFAATGAPGELLDGISRLFLIPHERTRSIAADFVAEDATGSVAEFVRRLRDDTVVRLGIRDALLGTDLMEKALARLLRHVEDLSSPQPFRETGIGFLATATNLVTEQMKILGVQRPEQDISYDFAQAALGSSAFPLAFPPRRESQIYPGNGRRDIFYGDGGMFDNLPFVPATLVLGAAQFSKLKGLTDRQRWTALTQRLATPDLFVVGALDVDPDPDPGLHHGRSIVTISGRAGSLAKNIKTHRFERLSERVDESLRQWIETRSPSSPPPEVVDHFVHAGVLTAAPSSTKHLNGTFAFCQSLGLGADRVSRSIADGCYRLLGEVREKARGDKPAARALQGVGDRLARVSKPGIHKEKGDCPYFSVDARTLRCPFFRTNKPDVWQQCVDDKIHGD